MLRERESERRLIVFLTLWRLVQRPGVQQEAALVQDLAQRLPFQHALAGQPGAGGAQPRGIRRTRR